jgi:hypothetical protein
MDAPVGGGRAGGIPLRERWVQAALLRSASETGDLVAGRICDLWRNSLNRIVAFIKNGSGGVLWSNQN